MTRKGIRIYRKVLAIKPSYSKNRRGNPDVYWYLFECGHIRMRFYSPSTSMDMFMIVKNIGAPERKCHLCSTGRMSVDDKMLDMIKDIFGFNLYLNIKDEREYKDSLKSLSDSVPQEFHQEFTSTQAYKYRHLKVVARYMSHEKKWPGNHKYVHSWWELDDGHAIGWNENPSRGYSFPVVKLKSSSPRRIKSNV